MIQLSLRDVHIRYPVFHHGRAQSLLSQVARSASFGALGRGDAGDTSFVHALRGINLDLREGDRVGLIGGNGAGKSTLLKTLAGISWPHAGTRTVTGRICNVISAGAGLDPEKTGLENIDFIGRLLGYNRPARAALTEDLVAFTQLGEFLALPVRTYSSGMQIRLTFGLATALPGEILLIDEVIGAGDAFFLERAAARVRALAEKARILVIASHSGSIITEFCTHAIWMHHGQIVDFGEVHEVQARYGAGEMRFPEGVSLSPDGVRTRLLAAA